MYGQVLTTKRLLPNESIMLTGLYFLFASS